MGGREDVGVAEPGSSPQQGLRAATRGSRSHDLWRDEPPDATQASEGSGVKARTVTDLQLAKLLKIFAERLLKLTADQVL